jgi:large repetitive protein
MSGKMLLQAVSRYLCVLFAVLAMHALVASPAQAAHTSVECPPQSGTVTTGGTVSINVTDCATIIGFAGIGAVDGPALPANGTANLRIAGSQWFLDYSHNGNSATSDVFEFTDGTIASNTVRVTITITPSASPITVSPGSLPTMTAGTAFSQSLTATGGAAPYTYALQSGALPVGLSLSSGGVLSGTPTQRGIYTFSVRATDSTAPTAQFADKGYSGTVQSPALSLAASTGTAIQGVAFSQTLNTIGGVAPYSYLLETGTLPAGITLSSGGIFSGTTSAAPGSFPVTIRVTDASTGPGQYFEVESFTLTVSPPPAVSIAVAPASVSEDGTTNLVYTVTRSLNLLYPTTVNITTSGAATSGSDYTGGVATVTIPANATTGTVTIDPSADTTGEPNETVILTVAAGAGYTVGAPNSATGTITNDDGSSTYPGCATRNVTVANGGTVRVDLSTCHFFGLGVVATAPTNGTATAGPGPVNYYDYTHNGNSAISDRFVVLDDNSQTIVINVTISAPTSSIVVSPSSLSAMTAGTVFSQTLTSTGGVAPYVYTLDSGALPIGLTLSSGGAITGTPTQRGSYSFGVRSTDLTSPTAQFSVKGYTGTVAAASLTLVSGTGTAIQGVAFSQTLATTNGVAPFAYQVETGSLPAGITISAAGVLSGTTSSAVGPYAVTIRVTDSSTGTGTNFQLQPFTLTVSPPPSVSIAVTPASVAEDGATNLVYTVTRSLNLSSPTTVNIATSGNATSGTDYTGGVATVTIPAGATTATITVDPTVDTSVEPNETVVLTIAAGTGYTVGAPASATGTITNDDVTNLSINDVTLNEGNAGTATATFTVSLSAPAGAGGVTFDIGTANGTATGGVDYVTRILAAQTIAAGASTYAFDVLVNGDVLNEANETFFVNVTNVAGATVVDGQGVGTITNDDVLPSLSTSNISVTEGNSGTTNAVVTVTLSAASGQTVTVNYAAANGSATSPADYTATSGTLTFAPGEISKTITVPVIGETVPEADETFSVGLFGATNATINVPTSFVTITNDDVPVTVSPGSFPGGTVATAYSQTITASGGTAPYSFAVTAGALPAGLTLSGGGVLSGTPTAGGTFNFTVTGTDASGAPGPFSGSQAYTVTVAAPTITLSAAALAGGTRGSPYSASITAATGGTAPYAYAVTAGALPGSLTLNTTSGAISGAPSAIGIFNFSITATDSSTGTGPYTATQSYSISVVDVPPVASGSSLTIGYNAAGTNVPLSLAGGAPTSLAIATTPAHGTAIVTGTTFSYQPTASYAGSDRFAYTATNSGGTSVPATVTITVSDPVFTIAAGGSLTTAIAVPYSQTFSFSGGAQPWSGYQVTGLPTGLSITGSTANNVTVSGTPAQAGSFTLNVSATDSSTGNGPFTVGQSFALTVAAPTLSLTPAAGVLTAPYGAPYTQAFTASGGIGGYSYSQGGSLPMGLSFSGGSISGTPTLPGSYNFSITATDNGASGTGAPFAITQNYTIDVPSPVISVSPASLPGGTAAAPYAQTIGATGGVSPLNFTLGSGALPAGLTLGSGGTLSGTPTAVGSFTFSIIATDTNGQSGSRSYTLAIAAPTLALTPASGSYNVAYGGTVSQAFTASGGNGPYSFAASGSLPAGVTLNSSTGALSGSTIAVGSYAFTITATDTGTTGAGAPFTVARNYTLVVAPPVVAITPASLPGATVGNNYSSSLSATGGGAPYSFAVTAGALPAGLNLCLSGTLSGTPTAGGSFSFTATASDASPAPGPFTANQAYTLSVAAPVITLPPSSLPGGQRGSAYSATLNPASGGTAPYSYAVTAGALPAGMALSSTGALSGTPTAFGSFAFTVTATDSSSGTGPYSANQSYSIAIVDQPPVAGGVTASLPYGAPATPIALNLSGGAATAVTISAAPANGIASVSGTTISYQPNASFSGTDSFSYIATNGGGTSAPATATVTVGAPALTITASGPLTATVGARYAQTFAFAGGTAPFGSHLVAGLPAGLALTGTTANSVTITGTPRSQGTFTLSVSASDSSTGNGPFVASQSFTLTVAPPNLAITPTAGSFTAPYATPFRQSFAASGGVGPYSYTLGGGLPAGVTLNAATGAVSGTPTVPGSFALTITATDTGATGPAGPFTVRGNYTLVVAAPSISITPATLSAATAGTAYSATLIGSGAVAPYSFSLSGGALPAGITLATTGQLSGTPTASGSFPFTVTVRDTNGQTAAAGFTLAVNVPTLAITPATLPTAVQGIAYSQTLSATGGIAPYSFAVSSGSLPAGLALNNATGVISGTPTTSGTANFAITATDSTAGTRATATVNYALQITARPDPANDPEVRGLVQAQVMATRRFADAQVNNFMRRLEGLHGEGSSGGGFQNGLRFSAPGYCQDSVTAWTSNSCAESEGKYGPVTAANASDSGDASNRGGGLDVKELPWTLWAGGTIRFGDRDPATGRLSQKFESEGITFGGDYRFSPSFAAGVGVGLGRDTVDVGDKGSHSKGEAKTIAIYGSHQLGSGIYFDWLGGYQALDFDLRRYGTPTGALVNSSRSGRQWFATASTGADFETGNWLITPYARIDMTRGRLKGYTENSGSLFDLTFLDQDVDFTSLGLGTRINYRHIFKGGALLPRLRIEYQYDLERNADARVAYFDRVSGPFSTIPLSGLAREQLMLGAGVELQLEAALALELEYLNRIASGSGSDQSVQVGVKVKF